jgi:hypothetical protein
MHIDDESTPTTDELGELKTMKAQVTKRQQIKLHALEVLEGRNLSESVRASLDAYLEDVSEETLEAARDPETS